MPNIGNYPSIDYTDLIEDLKEDLSSGIITEESNLYVVRQLFTVTIKRGDETLGEFAPVLDYLFERPELESTLTSTTVREAKKLCRDTIENLGDDVTDEGDSIRQASEMLLDDLEDYTKMNKKRNDRKCKVLLTSETKDGRKSCPMMVYLEKNEAGDEVGMMTAGDLMKEFELCNG